MTSWQTILTFTYPHEAHMAKLLLESEDIETMITDELTVQVDNFYSNAIGGVKLKVMEGDVEKSIILLKEGGYIVEIEKTESRFMKRFDQFTNKIPLIGKHLLVVRLFIVLTLFVTVAGLLVFIFFEN
ncbi:MAG: hypothetical protein A2W91_02790 [Bacteroidetes bacterium GWF2_38_335]|nr:MAG: hypothetical protein A2W91_02790 [Bacteroidetes bacterium GWF2_38_335]OFY77579.1 MAG: hypothetical protein A2281_01970 [Bacteroidetes bacterium RIFOXYA12_FULL_38_20]HBS87120.1 hypothetical protein [Bacteroidales bacterium]